MADSRDIILPSPPSSSIDTQKFQTSQIQLSKAHSDVCVPNLREEQQRNLEASIHTCTTRTIHYTRRRWSARGTWTCEIGSRACDKTWKGNGRTFFRKGSLNINDRQTGRWMLLYSFRKGVQKSIFISSSVHPDSSFPRSSLCFTRAYTCASLLACLCAL